MNLEAICAAIKAKYVESPLTLEVNGLFYDHAPPGTEFPYITYFVVDALPEYSFNTQLENVRVQFSVWSYDPDLAAEQSPLTVMRIGKTLTELYDDCSLTISGYDLVRMHRVGGGNPVGDPSPDGGWQLPIDYMIRVQEV